MPEPIDPETAKQIKLGEALYEIRDTAGFQAYLLYLGELQRDAAIRGIEDRQQHIEYSRGYLSAVRDVAQFVDRAIARASELKEQVEEDGDTSLGVRIGRGGALAEEEVSL